MPSLRHPPDATGPDRAASAGSARTSASRYAIDLALGTLPLSVVAGWASKAFDLTPSYAWTVGVVYAALSGIVLARAPHDLPRPGLGWANRVTLFRATLVVPVAALLVTPGRVQGSLAGWALAAALVALALDGVDGAVARRTRGATSFGARFDMELDAFLILVLSLLVWTSTPLGAWVVAIGAVRYVFVGAAHVWTALEGELPPSFRRKLICVVQIGGLLVALAPWMPTRVATVAAATALALLLYSFAVDIRWLLLRPDSARAAGGS